MRHKEGGQVSQPAKGDSGGFNSLSQRAPSLPRKRIDERLPSLALEIYR